MDVSIIILNYNTYQLTCDCIESVISKTTGVNYEIILVDNNSIEVDPKEFLKRFPGITLVESEINDGFAKGNNRGITKAKGKYLLLLNSDTILFNNAVEACFQFLEQDTKNTAVVTARLENPDGTHQCNCQHFPSIRYSLLEFLRIQKFLPTEYAGNILLGYFFDYKKVIYPDWVWGTFFMFPKKLLHEFPDHKLHDDYFMYVEDVQWCLEFRLRGYQIAFEPKGIVIHLNGQSKGNKPKMMYDNTIAFMKTYYSPLSRFFIKVSYFMLTGNYTYP